MDINEIANRAGVSRATVSRYLNNGYVSQQKRDLISRIIKETGYVPSKNARQLRTGKTHTIGVIIPKIHSQSVSRMVAGISNVLDANGYQIVLGNTENDTNKEIEYLRLLCRKEHIDGVIFMATVITPEHKRILKNIKIPFVILGQKCSILPSVFHDDYGAVRDISRLVLPNARNLGYLGVLEEDMAVGRMRHKGFLDACGEAGLTIPEECQVLVDFNADAGYFGAEKLLDVRPDIDTIVCATDEIAFGALMCMHEYGRRVPEDVQITGVGDSLLSRILHPSLTTVHLPYKTSGAKAAELLLSQMEGEVGEPVQLKMDYQVYARNSIR